MGIDNLIAISIVSPRCNNTKTNGSGSTMLNILKPYIPLGIQVQCFKAQSYVSQTISNKYICV